jgi:hypothetical protein
MKCRGIRVVNRMEREKVLNGTIEIFLVIVHTATVVKGRCQIGIELYSAVEV